MGAEGAVNIIFRKQIEAADDPEATRAGDGRQLQGDHRPLHRRRQRHGRRHHRPARDAAADHPRARDGGDQARRAAVEEARRDAGVSQVARSQNRFYDAIRSRSAVRAPIRRVVTADAIRDRSRHADAPNARLACSPERTALVRRGATGSASMPMPTIAGERLAHRCGGYAPTARVGEPLARLRGKPLGPSIEGQRAPGWRRSWSGTRGSAFEVRDGLRSTAARMAIAEHDARRESRTSRWCAGSTTRSTGATSTAIAELDPDVELDEWPEAPDAQTFHGPDGVRAGDRRSGSRPGSGCRSRSRTSSRPATGSW